MKTYIFCTFSYNPKWSEIAENFDQVANHRPALVAIIFHAKLNVLIKDTIEEENFNKMLGYVHTKEFQKRGLLQAHILINFDDPHKFHEISHFDIMFKVELPDPIAYHKHCMIQGPSGSLNLGSPCMVKGKC